MTDENIKKCIAVVLLVVTCLLCFFVIGKYASEPETFDQTYKVLDEKENTVMKMTTAAATAATAITILPGDAGTPIAEKLTDYTGYFVFIIGAIILEKWLMSMFGLLAFKIIIPICLLLMIAGIILSRDQLKSISWRLILFALILFLVVPTSTLITTQIEKSYKASIEKTIDDIEKESKKVEDNSDDGLIARIKNKIQGAATNFINGIEEKLKAYTEYIAMLIVTSCVIPLGVLAFYIWLIKLITGVTIKIPKKKLSGRVGPWRKESTVEE